jgi:hypothetical protein
MLGLAVACVAASTLLLEITLTRLFSVLLLNHFSFFAVGLAMSGLAFGGLWMSRWRIDLATDRAYAARLAALALLCSVASLAGLAVLLIPLEGASPLFHLPAMMVFIIAFTAAGAFLAAAFARCPLSISALYACDLLAAAAACIGSIVLLRRVEGPAVLIVPALLFGIASVVMDPTRIGKAAGVLLVIVLGGFVCVASWRNEPLLRFRGATRPGAIVFERWNEYSRVQGLMTATAPQSVWFVIDRTAATQMYRIKPTNSDSASHSEPWWDRTFQALAYHTGRPLNRVAVIGVGGGIDLLPPLKAEVPEIFGFELNQIFIDLLRRDFSGFNSVARRPEVTLVHSEARTALEHERRRFDLIQASLTDTWAATAAGGFVLAENGLYTLEGWRLLLDRLTPGGILTMTRWYIPSAPAEMQRLVALASAAVEATGVPDPGRHIVLAVTASEADHDPALGPIHLATILVSKAPFTSAELERLRAAPVAGPVRFLIDPTRTPDDTVLSALLAPDGRAKAIAASPFDITPPTDLRPYFFLQVRPSSLPLLLSQRYRGPGTEVTFNGVRVLLVMVAWTSLLALGMLWAGIRTTSGSAASGATAGTGYFLGIGLGYMLVQLGLHQRLTLLLGQPTYALSIVLFSLLLGTGVGAAIATRLAPAGYEARAWCLLLATVAAAALFLPGVEHINALEASGARHLVLVALLMLLGATLGTAFPIGVRMVAPHGPDVVQRMWAVNGAASIAGSALAALIGLAAGSQAVIFAGLVCYGLAVACGWLGRSGWISAQSSVSSSEYSYVDAGVAQAIITGA